MLHVIFARVKANVGEGFFLSTQKSSSEAIISIKRPCNDKNVPPWLLVQPPQKRNSINRQQIKTAYHSSPLCWLHHGTMMLISKCLTFLRPQARRLITNGHTWRNLDNFPKSSYLIMYFMCALAMQGSFIFRGHKYVCSIYDKA